MTTPLTLAVAGPAADAGAAADGSSPGLSPEVFAALLTSATPAPPATSPPTAAPTAEHEVAETPDEQGTLPAPSPLSLDTAASWLLSLDLPRQPVIVVPKAAEGTTAVPGAGPAPSHVPATTSPDTAPSGLAQHAGAPVEPLPQKAGAPVEPPLAERLPTQASSMPHPQAMPVVSAASPNLSVVTLPNDPSVLGPGLVQVTAVGPAPDVDRTETLAAVRPALVAAAETLRTEGGRTSLVIRLDPPELGALLVRMTVRDGQVEISVRAPDAAAHGGLLAQTPELQQVLREAGLDLKSYDVSYGGLTRDDPDGQQAPPDRGTPRSIRTADGTVHVTDDVPDPQPAGTWL